MKIYVRVKPGARIEGVTKVDDSHFTVCVKEPPIQDRANKAVIRVLSEYLNIPGSCIHILHGSKGRNKVFEIFQK